MHSFFYAATVLASTLTLTSATGSHAPSFHASANTNLAVYWGQGPYQKPLRHFCDDESIDIIPIGFVNVFPDQPGANGYAGTNFGNACGGSYYRTPEGKETRLLASCSQIGSDIKYCQARGKKILLSLGGAQPDVYLASDSSAKAFTDFLWGAFGPVKQSWEGPRPFGDACVDGFDFDIESHKEKIIGEEDFGYATMVDRFRELFAQEAETYYISGAPQCIIPDSHLSDAISRSVFDFIFVQFYNTPQCSARAGLDHTYGAWGGPATDISFDSWVSHVQSSSASKGAKIYLGLPGAPEATWDRMYLSPSEAQQLIDRFQCKYPTMFGGVMLWEATYSENNQIAGMSYGKHIKQAMANSLCAEKPSYAETPEISSTTRTSSTAAESSSASISASEVDPMTTTTSSSSATMEPTSSITSASEDHPETSPTSSSPAATEPTTSTSSAPEDHPVTTPTTSSSSATVEPTSSTGSGPEDHPTTSSTSCTSSTATESSSAITSASEVDPVTTTTSSSSATVEPTSSTGSGPEDHPTTSSTSCTSSTATESSSAISSASEVDPVTTTTSSSSAATESAWSTSSVPEEHPETSSTTWTSSAATESASSITSSPENHSTAYSTESGSTPTTSCSLSSSASRATTIDEVSVPTTTTIPATPSPSSCGVRGYDLVHAYDFSTEAAFANFDMCGKKCIADSACVSFAIGNTQCLLYTQTVELTVIEDQSSPFTFYDRVCAASLPFPPTESSSTPVVSESHPTASESHSTASESASESHPTASESHPTASQSTSESHPTASESQPTASEPHPTASETISSVHTSQTVSPTSHPDGSASVPATTTRSSTASHPETSEAVTSHVVTTTTHLEESASITTSLTHTSSQIHPENPETITSHVDVTITSCPPEATACPTKPSGDSPPVHSPSSSSVNSISSYQETTSALPTLNTEVPESYTTVITTNYVGICPTGYTTIPYTTTVVTTPGSGSTPAPTSGVPAGFTTTVAVCPQCNSASPTVTLTIPVISVVPVPIPTESPSGSAPLAGPPPAGPPPAGTPPVGPSSLVSPGRPSSPAGHAPSGPAAPESSAPPATSVSLKPTTSASGHAMAVPTMVTPPYGPGNSTTTLKTAASSGDHKPTSVHTGLSGAEATRPAPFTGAASKATEGTFVAVLIAAIWAGMLAM